MAERLQGWCVCPSPQLGRNASCIPARLPLNVFEKRHFGKRQIQVQGKWKVVYLNSVAEEEMMKLQLNLGQGRSLFNRGSNITGSENIPAVESTGLRNQGPRVILGSQLWSAPLTRGGGVFRDTRLCLSPSTPPLCRHCHLPASGGLWRAGEDSPCGCRGGREKRKGGREGPFLRPSGLGSRLSTHCPSISAAHGAEGGGERRGDAHLAVALRAPHPIAAALAPPGSTDTWSGHAPGSKSAPHTRWASGRFPPP